ncbi:dihydroorotate dehydrogenase electron transfer subunit [Ferrovibrio sp.]|uniref:dihydroorotate dehydrogenase electron transfer subunit n=1 Tax=Ferrovibrio sp. TaxID=1917215 RepID=UPI0025BB93B0|nr:dihydroorotate dehydrogenase electron transfer subunit [Ferrovibrio sp.]MBX3453700.1 dihydroorotate dehydrogenase electron transfer subunit [Ferrovibrio sp.]
MTIVQPRKAIFPRPVAEQALAVLANDPVNDDYKHLVLQAGQPFTQAQPGQFFHLLCPSGDGLAAPYFRRPMSCYRADPQAGRLEFLYKLAGRGTRALGGLHAGDSLNVLGPLGKGFRLHPDWRHILVLGRGVGLATLAPLAEAACASGMRITAILSARRHDLVMSAERFAAAGADVLPVHDDDGSSAPENLHQILEGLVQAGNAPDAVFSCGSNRLLRLLQDYGRRHGIPGQVAVEQQMACGLGMCFCCVRPFGDAAAPEHRRVCWDGPVFDMQETHEC